MTEEERVEDFEDRVMARFRRSNKDIELNFDEVRVQEIALNFYRNGQRSGAIYESKGDVMIDVEPGVKQNFMSFNIPLDYLKKVVSQIERSRNVDIVEDEATLDEYKHRMFLD